LGDHSRPFPGKRRALLGGFMPKKAVWLIIIFTLLFILGINSGELNFLLNLGNTICLSCIGVG
jgi:hypothetical protein